MGYTIAAYALVIGCLGWYGWRVQRQRRELMRQEEADRASEPGS